MIEQTSASGWADDDLDAALLAYQKTAESAGMPLYQGGGARDFFENEFAFGRALDADFTGYFEPVYRASRDRTGDYRWPIYRAPADNSEFTRAEIMNGALAGQGLEDFWLSDPMDAYLLGIQGSGRLKLADGSVARVNYACGNCHDYRSIGQILIARGDIPERDMSADALRHWVRANGEAGLSVLAENPAFVFFRELTDLPESEGPIGAMGAPLTDLRSIAVDPDHHRLGAPIWIERANAQPTLCIAQDVGSAIKGAGRVDVFIGVGEVAGRIAGGMREKGRITPLIPRIAS
ncbi:MAG: MltA domain-containing protein [Pseudomonadota bacterium]